MKCILLFQGVYFFVTAIWPLVDISSFIVVTGPKTDVWLVKTVALLLLAIAGTFIVEALSKKSNRSVIVLALTSSFALASVDIYFTAINRIRKVYLLDAVIEIMLMILMIFVLISKEIRIKEQK